MLEGLMNMLYPLGYVGVFLAGFFSTFTLFLPSPTFIAIFVMAKFYNPFLLGILGGLGATIGEMIGYCFGYGIGYGASHVKKSFTKYRERIKEMFKKYRASVVIFLFAVLPILPFDLVGLFCGIIKYDTKRFFLLTLAGKIIKYLILAYAGFYSLNFILSFFKYT